MALLIKTFPPLGFSAEGHWLQARAEEDSRTVLIAESLPREEPGVWIVRIATVIPDNERWLHEPEAAANPQTAQPW